MNMKIPSDNKGSIWQSGPPWLLEALSGWPFQVRYLFIIIFVSDLDPSRKIAGQLRRLFFGGDIPWGYIPETAAPPWAKSWLRD